MYDKWIHKYGRQPLRKQPTRERECLTGSPKAPSNPSANDSSDTSSLGAMRESRRMTGIRPGGGSMPGFTS